MLLLFVVPAMDTGVAKRKTFARLTSKVGDQVVKLQVYRSKVARSQLARLAPAS